MSAPDVTGLNGVRVLCRDLVDSLRQGCSVVWLLPLADLEDPLLEVVSEESARWGLTRSEVDLLDRPASPRSPLRQLVDRLGLDHGNKLDWKLADVVQASSVPDITILRNLADLAANEQEQWCQFAAQWSRTAHGTSSTSALLIPATQELKGRVELDVRLQVRRFWQYVSEAELRLLALPRIGTQRVDTLWGEFVYASVAAGDPFLLDALVDALPGDLPSLQSTLEAYGESCGWTRSSLIQANAERLCDLPYAARIRSRADVPSEFHALWHMGAVVASHENGLELHSAAAALLGRNDTVQHRIWRGQVQHLLPMLDSVRQAISHYLTRYQGPEWISLARAQHPLDIHGSPTRPMSEFNHLYNVLQSPHLRIPRRAELNERVRQLRDWRNELAHYQPLTRTETTHLYETVEWFEGLR